MRKLDPVTLLREFAIPFKIRSDDSKWATVSCPYHNDHKELDEAHGGVNVDTGAYNCFSCGHNKGGVVGFIAKTHGVTEDAVHAHHYNIFGTGNKVDSENDAALIALCIENLHGSPEFIQRIHNKHGLTLDTIRHFKLGLFPGSNRVTIPIYSEGQLVDIRQYKYGELKQGEGKLISRKNAKTALFRTCDVLSEQTIYITEGEFKAMILWQNGFPAVSSTHGASSWNDSFDRLMKGKDVVILYDVDSPGRKNAEKRCITLHRFANSVKNVYLTEVEDIDGGDVTDFFVKKGLSADALRARIEATPAYKPYVESVATKDDSAPQEMPLARTSHAEFYNKRIKTACVISAKDTAPYIIPKKVKVSCNRAKDYCTNCRVFDTKGDYTFDIANDTVDILELVTKSREGAEYRKVMMRLSGVYAGCKICSFQDILESYNIEELRVIPQLAVGHATDEQVTRKVFYVGHGINTNASYSIQARVATLPGDGHATLIVYDAQPTVDNIDNFKATEDLSLFKPTDWTPEAVEEKLNDIYADFESNVTRIKQRRDLHLVYDIAFHSVLYIPYEGRNIKGWADVLVIGDSGQGKSEASSRMSAHYKAGERVDSKRASVAGIVGGLQETNKRWFITWGTIPLNDRRLVILEEVKGMGVGELTKLTDMRSSGFAEIHKIERAKTYARTRLIWISNPRSDSKISTYNYGVDAVRELIGSLEDIRRFDCVIAVASGEVPESVINTTHVVVKQHVYTTEKCAELVQWAWSRKERDIRLDEDAVTEALAATSRLAKDFSSACPIVEPSDQRLKMLRMATALAARTYSTDDGENLVVRKCHVEVVERLLNRIYKSKALGYYEFSQAVKKEDNLIDEEKVREHVESMPHASEAATCLLEAENIRVEDVQNFTDWPLEKCNDFIGTLVRIGCLKRSKRGGYRKTSAFIDKLKELTRAGDLGSESYKEQLQRTGEI